MCWLINYILDIAGTETTTHLLLRADNLQMAELAARRMGRTWWEGSLSGEIRMATGRFRTVPCGLAGSPCWMRERSMF